MTAMVLLVALFQALLMSMSIGPVRAPVAATPPDSSAPPTTTVKLVFIHHSTGGYWLADVGENDLAGGLGRALSNTNYFVSATNYGWGPNGVGDRTDIPNWPEWFTGVDRGAIMQAVYDEGDQNIGDYGNWGRRSVMPAGENTIIVFKSCFPNSDMYGNPDDAPLATPDDSLTVANAKAVYNTILMYFATRPDKLFIVITAPPLAQGDYPPDSVSAAHRAANARAFNDWLMNNWLATYPFKNVAVFDYYNVMTSNGGNPNATDVGWVNGNHHRWLASTGAVQHQKTVNNNYAKYPSGDSHPNTVGQQKATTEFVPLLNVFYHRWKATAVTLNRFVYLPVAQHDSDPGMTRSPIHALSRPQ